MLKRWFCTRKKNNIFCSLGNGIYRLMDRLLKVSFLVDSNLEKDVHSIKYILELLEWFTLICWPLLLILQFFSLINAILCESIYLIRYYLVFLINKLNQFWKLFFNL